MNLLPRLLRLLTVSVLLACAVGAQGASSLSLTNVHQTRDPNAINPQTGRPYYDPQTGATADSAYTAFLKINTNFMFLLVRINQQGADITNVLESLQTQISVMIQTNAGTLTDVAVTGIVLHVMGPSTNWVWTNTAAHLAWLTNHVEVHPDEPYQFDQGTTYHLLSWESATKQIWRTPVKMTDDGIWYFPDGVRANAAWLTNLPLSGLQSGGAAVGAPLKWGGVGVGWIPGVDYGISSNAVLELQAALSNALYVVGPERVAGVLTNDTTGNAATATTAGTAGSADVVTVGASSPVVRSAVDLSALLTLDGDWHFNFLTNVNGTSFTASDGYYGAPLKVGDNAYWLKGGTGLEMARHGWDGVKTRIVFEVPLAWYDGEGERVIELDGATGFVTAGRFVGPMDAAYLFGSLPIGRLDSGGSVGQVLKKTGASTYGWQDDDVSAGSGGLASDGQTTGATTLNVFSIPLSDGHQMIYNVAITGVRSDGELVSYWSERATVKRSGASLSRLTIPDGYTWDPSNTELVLEFGSVKFKVTGTVGETIDWRGIISYHAP